MNMKRSMLFAVVLWTVVASWGAAQQAAPDAIAQEASRLETDLTRYKDTSTEAADILVKLVDIYHANGRVFGLVRAGQKFITVQSADKRHKAVMLKLLDGLEALSRNQDLIAGCRQFLERYPKEAEAAEIEVRLAKTLERTPDKLNTIKAWRAVWQRQAGSPVGRQAGARAMALCDATRTAETLTIAVELANDMIDKLPAGPLVGVVGYPTFAYLSQTGPYDKANLLGNKMLAKGGIADKKLLREIHRSMASNYWNLRQYANSAESRRKALQIQEDAESLYWLIGSLYEAKGNPAEIEALANQFIQKYPEREDRYDRLGHAGRAYEDAKDKAKALAIYKSLLATDPTAQSAASRVVQLSGDKPPELAETERLLLESIQKCPKRTDFVTYVLATELYDQRMKDRAKARQTLRNRLNSKSDDPYAAQCAQWLLGTSTDENEFRADVDRFAALRREMPDKMCRCNYFGNALAALRSDPKKKALATYLDDTLKKLAADPVLGVWYSQRSFGGQQDDAAVRTRLLEPGLFGQLSTPVKIQVLSQHAESLRHVPGRRAATVPLYADWLKLAPDSFPAAYGLLLAAFDENKPEPAKAAVVALLKMEPTPLVDNELCYRMLALLEKEKNVELGKQAYAWVKKAIPLARQPITDTRIGDGMNGLGLEKEALEYWKALIAADRDPEQVRQAAQRLRQPLTGAERAALDKGFLTLSGRYHGSYVCWVADDLLAANADAKGEWKTPLQNLPEFEKILRDLITESQQSVARNPEVDQQILDGWVGLCRDEKKVNAADRTRILAVVRDLTAGYPSAVAQVMLLDGGAAEKLKPIERLLAYQSATRLLGFDSNEWDRMSPMALAIMEKKLYAEASVLLTGLLANVPNVDESRRDGARAKAAQCYAQIGAVGMIIDEKSPLAPLLRATLYLRLGDEKLAFDAFIAHRALFAAHRHELPADLLLFAAERLIAAGGEENLTDVEMWLREWLIKNNESKQFDDAQKAQVQLLLARCFFKAQRYDVARAEFTTLINRFPKTPQAMEAQFGIGETYVSQKIYDQALAVFERLSMSRDSDVVIRAEFLRGVVAFQRGETEEARNIFRAVLDRVPSIELADKALFRLSEIYGIEQRYLDQLTLLRTVGRLGRNSKRAHVPGQALSIVVYDSDLGISRGHNRIPVIVSTEPGGDKELVYLTSAGAGKGLFRADLDTRLGTPTPNNRVLELSGRDKVRCDYPEEFRAQFRRVPLSDVEILVAADGKLEVSSSKEFEIKKPTFSDELQKEAQQAQEQLDPRVSQVRPLNQIKPGNPVYVRVTDADRDMTNEADQVIVKLAADSGDQVQVAMKETGPHTGVFEGMVKTGELPAGATATDAAIDHAALLAIDRDAKTYWQSEPDGRTPKALTVDMKDLKRVAGVKITVPDATKRAPVRAELQGSYDGAFWFRLGGNPDIAKAEPVPGEYGKMKRRVYEGSFFHYKEWKQVAELTKTKAVDEAEAEELTWSKPDAADAKPVAHAVIYSGKVVQPRAGAVRIQVTGVRTGLAIDGRDELPLGDGNRFVDVWLTAGTHDLTVFSAVRDARQPFGATWARSDLSSAKVTLHPFHAPDFDLSLPEAKAAGAPAPEAQLTREEATWQFAVKPVDLRYVRFVVQEYLGDAVAISNVEVTGEKAEVFVPPQVDVVALATNDILEIAGGDTLTATYIDEVIPGDGGRARVLTASLSATYFNADASPITYDFTKTDDGEVRARPRRMLRIEPGDRIIVQIRDYDEDRTNDPDTIPIEVAVNDGKPVAMTATETLPNSGLFTKEIDTSIKDEKERITVKPGDRVFCRYVDKQNTFPGHSVVREAVVLVNQPSTGTLRILDTVVKPAPPASKAPPTITYRRAPAGRDVSQVALAGPLSVEVIDPDSAKDAESSVVVSLQAGEGAKIDVRCVLPPNPSGQGPGNDAALTEGRFVGQLFLQLGSKGSPDILPLTTGLPRLIGGPVMEVDKEKPNAAPTATRVLNLAGKDLIAAVYKDQRRPDGKTAELSGKARMIENGKLEITDHAYEKPAERLYLGERLYLKVSDPDRDTSDERDTVAVEITTTSGEREVAKLEETLPHSGVFSASFLLKVAEKPAPSNLNPAEPAIEAFFGDTLKVKYVDPVALTETGELTLLSEVPVVVGTNGLVAAFSKTFGDEKLSTETKFSIAESHFELFKSHKKLDRKDEAKADLQAGREVLRELMEEHLDPKYAPRVAYLLGQFAQELGQWDEAINAYQSILRQFGEHPLAPDAQYKLAQSYEEMGGFDLALEAYVTLAATYPKSPLVASVMIRVADHFYKKGTFDVAAQVGEKFVEKFESHQHAPRMAFRIGQCHYKAGKFVEAGKAFDRFARVFAEDKLAAESLFWAGESYRMGHNTRLAYQRYNRCRWDFPSSEAAKYARGRLALPEMLAQFEADSQSVTSGEEPK